MKYFRTQMGSFLMPRKVPTDDKEVQTIIRVHPYILEDNSVANVLSDRKCQTLVTIKPGQGNKNFYSMLEYTPYQDIQESYVRIIDLPRKPRLQFDANSGAQWHLNNNLNNLYLDDDALSEVYLDLKKRIDEGPMVKRKTFTDECTQTDLKVQPHLLQSDKVATVSDNAYTQTLDNISRDQGSTESVSS